MYQFKYQTINPLDFYPPVELIFTCIVPTNWLSLDLPKLGGCVNYISNRDQLTVCGSVLCEFVEVESSDKMLRAFSLDIFLEREKCFEKPIVIHAPYSVQSEVVLLNHLFGFTATSCWVAVDFGDFITLLKRSSTYYLKYGTGKSVPDILPKILDTAAAKDVKCEFLMIFGDNKNLKLGHLEEAIESIDSFGIVCAAGVEQEEMLISILVGR